MMVPQVRIFEQAGAFSCVCPPSLRQLQPPQRRGAPRLRLRCLPLLLLAHTLLPLLDLGSGLSAEVFRLKHSANLDLGSPVERSALEPLDRLFHRPHLPQPEPGDQFLRFREWPVDHGPLSFGEPDPHAFRARMKPLARKHYACLHQLFVVLPHLGKEFLGRKNARLRVLVSLDYHHDSHRFISCLLSTWTWASRRYAYQPFCS